MVGVSTLENFMDDMIISSKSKVEIYRLNAQLGKVYEMKDMSATKK